MRRIITIFITVLLLNVSVSAFSAEKYEGDEVEAIQRTLRTLGYYSGFCDGIYSRDVERAVVEWQKNRGIPETGVCSSYELSLLEIEEKTPLEDEEEILSLASYLYENAKDAPRIYKTELGRKALRTQKNVNVRKPFTFDKECLRCAFECLITCGNMQGG